MAGLIMPWTAGMLKGGGFPPATISYQGNHPSTPNLSTYTFNDIAFGAASSDRVIMVAGFGAITNTTLSYVNIGGSAATIHVQAGGATQHQGFIASRAVPTGTTGTVVVSFGSTQNLAGIQVWAVYPGAGTVTLLDTGVVLNTEPASVGVDVEDGGFVIAACSGYSMNSSTLPTLSGHGLSSDVRANMENSVSHAASSGQTTNNATETYSADYVGGRTYSALYVASFILT